MSKLKSILARRTRLGRIAGDASGVAAIEFAMVVPLMVIMFLGAVELSEALSIDRRVTAIAGATADLVAQGETTSSAELDDIMEIADALLPPNINKELLEIKLYSAVADDDGDVTVDWSYGNKVTEPYAPDTPVTDIPDDLVDPLTSVIIAEVKFSYTPPIAHFISGTIDLQERAYLRPRRSMMVTKNDEAN